MIAGVLKAGVIFEIARSEGATRTLLSQKNDIKIRCDKITLEREHKAVRQNIINLLFFESFRQSNQGPTVSSMKREMT